MPTTYSQDAALVVAVVLNWNNAPDTCACLASLAAVDYPALHTLVVDNGSTDGSAEAIAAAFPGVELLRTGANLGYAGGNNAGIARALALNAAHVLVLNNDVLVEPAMVRELVAVMDADAGVGMVGPVMYCLTGDAPGDAADARLFAAGSDVHWWRGDTRHRGLHRTTLQWPLPAEPTPAGFIAGCGVLVRASVVRAVGVLDEGYFLNFEDVEWSVRVRRAGFGVVLAPRAVLWHKVSATLDAGSPLNQYYMTRNALRFFWRCAPWLCRPAAVAAVAARALRCVAAWSLRRRYRQEVYRRRRRCTLLALRDFVRGRSGPMSADVAAACGAGA